jgi:hypothetical protein
MSSAAVPMGSACSLVLAVLLCGLLFDPEDRGSAIFQTDCERLADYFTFQKIVVCIMTAVRTSKPTDDSSPHIPLYFWNISFINSLRYRPTPMYFQWYIWNEPMTSGRAVWGMNCLRSLQHLWVRIPLEAWMSVWVYSVFVLSCV